MVALTNQEIIKQGGKLLTYRPLPAPKMFHRSQAKYRLIFGGNRSGKSESNMGADICAFALNTHPHRAWKREECVIWAAGETWADVGKIIWKEKIKSYIPAYRIQDVVWHNKREEIPKEVRLDNGCVIEFKAFSQGREEFQGRGIDAFYQDEQCQHGSEEIWHEVQMRLLDYEGFATMSLTPIKYQKWLEELTRNTPDDYEVFYADLEDNRKSRGGHIEDAEISRMIALFPPEVRATRVKGYFGAFKGTVYQSFRRKTHVIKPFEIPSDWDRYRGIDFGHANPFACVWLARDPHRNWYVYREHYRAQELLSYHARRIAEYSKGEIFKTTWSDHDSQDRAELDALGLQTTAAKKDVSVGIEAVQRTMTVNPDTGKPRFFIFDTCPNTISEHIGYHYQESKEERDAKDEPVKKLDHTCDAVRYVIFGVEGKSFFSEDDLA